MDIRILDSRITEQDLKPQTAGSAAIDLRACLGGSLRLLPGDTAMIPSGIALWIKDPKFAGIIIPRSGLGHKQGVVLGNLVGLIDSDYQGEIQLSVWNRSDNPFFIRPMDRIAQLIIVPIATPDFNIVSDFDNLTQRGNGGFNSTGTQ